MKFNNTQDLLKRENIALINMSSKKDNYKIASVYISPYTLDKKNEEISNKFEKNMLKYFSYEIIHNIVIKLYFDFNKYKEDLGINANECLPIPYLIRIHIIDDEIKTTKKHYEMKLIADKIINYENEFFDINLKRADYPDNEDFVIIRAKIAFLDYYIVHKNEEDWIKLWIYKMKSELE